MIRDPRFYIPVGVVAASFVVILWMWVMAWFSTMLPWPPAP